MRIFEITDFNSPDKLLALSQLIRGRLKNTATDAAVSVDAFIKMARGLGMTIDRESLTDLIASPPLSNIITGVDGDQLQFHGQDEMEVESPSDVEQDADHVKQLAKRQLPK